MTQAITQAVIETNKATIMEVREVEGPLGSRRPVHMVKEKSASTEAAIIWLEGTR